MLNMISLVPQRPAQHLAWTPELSVHADDLLRAFERRQDFIQPRPRNFQPRERLVGNLLERGGQPQPVEIPALRPTGVFQDAGDAPTFVGIGLIEFLSVQVFDGFQQILAAPGEQFQAALDIRRSKRLPVMLEPGVHHVVVAFSSRSKAALML